jgi:hypothetical protein
MYNKYVTAEKIAQYDKNIDEDAYIPSSLKKNSNVREVCRAGLYLHEELEKLNCPDYLITRIQWTAGKLSFKDDPWEVHSSLIEQFKNNSLVIEDDEEEFPAQKQIN